MDDAIRRYEPAMRARAAGLAAGANRATQAFFGIGVDDEDTYQAPDTSAEHRRYHQNADRYLHGRALTGDWTLTFQTGGGEQRADLSLRVTDEGVTGALDGRMIDDASADGDTVRFRARITSPFPATLRCEASVAGDTLTGRAKHPMMSIAFTGARKS
ncbi:hypothetical protein [Catenuloplanes japonicus]|uniref:hypothetical protein n=1 Tax=Catenuloplanes japonicus TaxID=33876 RepID=UPI00068EFA22|nr:hypothetical protein [Catenuloplanes japonicus]